MLLGDSAKRTAMNQPDCVHMGVYTRETATRLKDREFYTSSGDPYS
jgi:hypothetical protein